MKNEKNLLTIGEFSKQTDVSIKSLRYYDEIGILTPVYIDEQTNYRYYSFEQIAIVNIIKLCVGLGIPLKEIKNFAQMENSRINYDSLINYGIELTENSMVKLQKKLNYLKAVKKDLSRINSYSFKESKMFEMPEKYCSVLPYQENVTPKNYRLALKNIFAHITSEGYKVGYESGILFRYSKNLKEQFIFLDIDDYNGSKLPEHILYIPASKYICKKSKHSLINNAPTVFPEQFSKDYTKVVIESWKYNGEFHTSDTFSEIRCSL